MKHKRPRRPKFAIFSIKVKVRCPEFHSGGIKTIKTRHQKVRLHNVTIAYRFRTVVMTAVTQLMWFTDPLSATVQQSKGHLKYECISPRINCRLEVVIIQKVIS